MVFTAFFRFGWHRSLSSQNRLKKIVYFLLGDPATPTQIRILPFLTFLNGREVGAALDIGISHGSLVYYLADRYPNARIWGVDVVEEFLEEARKVKKLCGNRYDNVTILPQDIQKPLESIGGTKVDMVTMFDVLEHIKDYEAAIENVGRHIAPGGLIVIGTPYFNDGGSPVPENKSDVHVLHIDHEWKGFSTESLGNVLGRHGFRVKKDLSGIGLFGRWALKLYYFCVIDRSKNYSTGVTPAYKNLPFLFLALYPLIFSFVLLDVYTRYRLKRSEHCLVVAEKN